MDAKHTGAVLRLLDKQNELLVDSYSSMSNELHKLQVEEEMLMRKYYEFMSAQGLVKKAKDGNEKPGAGTTNNGEVPSEANTDKRSTISRKLVGNSAV